MGINNQETIEGDNLEFNVAVAADITCEVNGGVGGANTSANNTLTTKYTNSAKRRKTFALRPSEAVQIISINGTIQTDPYSCVKNGRIIEKFDSPFLYKMVIRVLTDNTNIKLRVR